MGTYGAFGAHDHTSEAIVGPESEGGESGISGLIRLLINNQGSNLVFGDVVALDTSGDNLVKKTATLGDMDVIGVVAKTGPFANGESVPVLISGYHASVKVTGAVARGDYLQASNTDGSAETIATPDAGTFARVVADDVGGFAAAIIFDRTLSASAVQAFTDLTDVPSTYSGASAGDLVVVNATVDGLEFGTASSGGDTEYRPTFAPASPSAYDDEFNDLSLHSDWTIDNTGGGASGTIDETLRKGFVQIPCTSGGTASSRKIRKTYTPGAVALTVAARGFLNTRDTDVQARLELRDSSGNIIFGVGMLTGHLAVVFNVSTFSTFDISYLTTAVGEIYLMIQRDSGTNYSAFISNDGEVWTRLTGSSEAGTIGRLYLASYADTAHVVDAWWDFVRTFTSNTFTIGGVSAEGMGATGQQGDIGPMGPPGERGDTGPIGEQGYPGPQGPAGTNGTNGAAGAAGATGAAGAMGPPGDMLWRPSERQYYNDPVIVTPSFPYRFLYKRNTDITLTKNVPTVVIFDTLVHDNTGAFNTSTGVFVAPVSGYYQINIVIHGKFASGTYAVGDFFIASFGNSAATEIRRYQQYEVTATPAVDIHLQLSGSSVEFLAAGSGYGALATVLCANNQSITATGNTVLNSFSAHLLSR